MMQLVHNLMGFFRNVTLLRREALELAITGNNRDIDAACGYPKSIDAAMFQAMFDRNGVATRIVKIFAEESWARTPEVYETEEADETSFEKAWKELVRDFRIWSYLSRVDTLSGIGRYGVLLFGVGDGGDLKQAISAVENEEPMTDGKLLYLRPFSENDITIESYEENERSKRFGYPKSYSIRFQSTNGEGAASTKSVHWTRVLHVADNRLNSEIFGVPRLQNVYNILLDIKKVGGGSGEMFWRGGFPGYSFELQPEAAAAGSVMDSESIKDEMELYSNDLQRFLALSGVTTKSLAPQVADPTGHLDMFLKIISLAKGIPFRIFLGSEQAKLASAQDKTTWNTRVRERQENYISPHILRPFIDHLILCGILPKPKEYFIHWPDLEAPGEAEVAKIAETLTKALAQFVTGSVDEVIPPREYLLHILGMEEKVVDAVLKALEKYQKEQEDEEEDLDNVLPGPFSPARPGDRRPAAAEIMNR